MASVLGFLASLISLIPLLLGFVALSLGLVPCRFGLKLPLLGFLERSLLLRFLQLCL